MRMLIKAFFLALLGAAPGAAQEMPPLQDWVKGPGAKQDPSYVFVRCAGLYVALARFDGQSLMPADLERMKRAYVSLATAAVAARAETRGGAPKDQVDGVSNDVGNFVDQYGGRIERNRRKAGKALDDDPAMTGDFALCQQTAASLPEG